jgi:lipopolysaccharide transport system ATP-binding protein
MRNTALSGRTVLFTSHDMESIKNICHSCILLDGGSVIQQGDVERCVRAYHRACEEHEAKFKV